MAIVAASLFLLTGADMPGNIPIPQPRPDAEPMVEETPEKQQDKAAPEPGKAGEAKPADKVEDELPPPIEPEDPTALAACLKQLDTLGVSYRESDPIDERNGCGIDYPIVVTSLGNGVALKPEGKMRCETALSLALWTRESVISTLRVARPKETLVGIEQASTYICRKRNSAETGKISEHAHGNAVDIAGFRFKSGDAFTIEPRMKDSTMDGAFQRAVTAAACLYFTTVLDPGSDAAHETHLHLDVIKRKSGYRLCW